jgi:hypothetical protein
LIDNVTKAIVITDDLVASAGERFERHNPQVGNVLVVCDNSVGALVLGNISPRQFPNPTLMVWIPISPSSVLTFCAPS